MRISTQEKRIKIIDVATQLFIEQGYKDTSLDQIVKICGGSKQTLYRYFNNKEGLFTEVLFHNTKQSMESVFHLGKNNNESLQETLENFAIQYFKGTCSNPLLGLFRIISNDFNKNDELPNLFWGNGPAQIHQYLIDFLETNQVCQHLNITDAPLACSQLLSLIKLDFQNKALLGLQLPNDDELKIHAHQTITAFLALYK